jgi:hypothetical protein
VRFNVEALLALRAGDEAHLTLPDGEDQVFLAERSIDHGGGITTWIARSERNGSNERAVITHGPAGTFGWIRTRYGEYRLYPGSGGVDWLAKRPARRHGAIDTRPAPADTHADRLLPHMPTFVEPHDRPKLFAMPKSTPAPATQGDVLVLYTPDLAKKLGTSMCAKSLHVRGRGTAIACAALPPSSIAGTAGAVAAAGCALLRQRKPAVICAPWKIAPHGSSAPIRLGGAYALPQPCARGQRATCERS